MTDRGVQALVEALRTDCAASRRLRAFLDRLAGLDGEVSAARIERDVAEWVGSSRDRRAWVADRIRTAVGVLAVDGTAPRRGPRREAWTAALAIAAGLYPSAVHRVSTRRVVGAEILAALTREGLRRQPRRRLARTQYAGPGPILKRLAVDPLLSEAVGRAAGFAVRPAYTAVYMYDPPGSTVPPHLDTAHFALVLHIVLAHVGAPPGCGSALVVYGPGRRRRLPLAVGEAVLLCGRGAVHQWEPLGPREHRVMVAIGYRQGSQGR